MTYQIKDAEEVNKIIHEVLFYAIYGLTEHNRLIKQFFLERIILSCGVSLAEIRENFDIIGGQGFVRVDVPELPASNGFEGQPAFTRLYGAGAIYSITPVSEEIAVAAAGGMRVRPVNVYLALPDNRGSGLDEETDDEEDDDEETDEVGDR